MSRPPTDPFVPPPAPFAPHMRPLAMLAMVNFGDKDSMLTTKGIVMGAHLQNLKPAHAAELIDGLDLFAQHLLASGKKYRKRGSSVIRTAIRKLEAVDWVARAAAAEKAKAGSISDQPHLQARSGGPTPGGDGGDRTTAGE